MTEEFRSSLEKELGARKTELETLKSQARRLRADSMQLSGSETSSPQSASPRVVTTGMTAAAIVAASNTGASGTTKARSSDAIPPKVPVLVSGPSNGQASGAAPAATVSSPPVDARVTKTRRDTKSTTVSAGAAVTKPAPADAPASPVEPATPEIISRDKEVLSPVTPVTATASDGLPQYSAADVAAALAESSVMPSTGLGLHMGHMGLGQHNLGLSTPSLSNYGNNPFGNLAAITASMSAQQQLLSNPMDFQHLFQQHMQQQHDSGYDVHSKQIVSSLGLDRDMDSPSPNLLRESGRPKVPSHARALDLDRRGHTDSTNKLTSGSTLSASAPPFQSTSHSMGREGRSDMTSVSQLTLAQQQQLLMMQMALSQSQRLGGVVPGLGMPNVAPVVYAATAGAMPALSRHAPTPQILNPLLPTLVRALHCCGDGCMHACMDVYSCMYVCMCVCMYIMCVCVYVCMHARACAWFSFDSTLHSAPPFDELLRCEDAFPPTAR
jgi:hypothetical protein